MTEQKIVPFADAAAKAAHDEAQQDNESPTAAIENLLRAFEGMDDQLGRLIEIVDDLQRRVVKLERVRDSKIMQVERLSKGSNGT